MSVTTQDDDTWTTVEQPKNPELALPRAFGGRATRRAPRPKAPESGPVLGVGDVLGTGDSYLVAGILPDELASVAFEKMKTEVKWTTMYHRGIVGLVL